MAHRQHQRSEVAATAIDLFLERGFDEVSVAEVAAAAGVPERTVYRWFPTKVDLVLNHHVYLAVKDLVRSAPAETPVLSVLAQAVRVAADSFEDPDLERARAELIRTTPALHSAWVTALTGRETAFREWLGARAGRPADDLEIAVAAAAIMAAYRVSVEQSATVADRPPAADRALAVLSEGLGSLFAS